MDVSAQNKDSHTPLDLALEHGYLEVVRMLIGRGIPVSARNEDGQTPLHLALGRGHLEVARMLIDRSAGV